MCRHVAFDVAQNTVSKNIKGHFANTSDLNGKNMLDNYSILMYS